MMLYIYQVQFISQNKIKWRCVASYKYRFNIKYNLNTQSSRLIIKNARLYHKTYQISSACYIHSSSKSINVSRTARLQFAQVFVVLSNSVRTLRDPLAVQLQHATTTKPVGFLFRQYFQATKRNSFTVVTIL